MNQRYMRVVLYRLGVTSFNAVLVDFLEKIAVHILWITSIEKAIGICFIKVYHERV